MIFYLARPVIYVNWDCPDRQSRGRKLHSILLRQLLFVPLIETPYEIRLCERVESHETVTLRAKCRQLRISRRVIGKGIEQRLRCNAPRRRKHWFQRHPQNELGEQPKGNIPVS